MVSPRATDSRIAAGGGLVAGLFGGFVLSIYTLFMHFLAAGGTEIWMPMKGAGIPLLGERAMQPGFDATAVAVGLLCHFAISAAWGVLFGLLFQGLSRGATLLAGAAWGLVVWLVMFYLVLPLVGLGQLARQMPMANAILEHLLFGLSVALGFLPFQREIRFREPLHRRETVMP